MTNSSSLSNSESSLFNVLIFLMISMASLNFTLTPEWVDLEPVINATVANFEGLARQKNLRLKVDCRLEDGDVRGQGQDLRRTD